MKVSSSILLFVVFAALTVSCSHDTTFTLSSVNGIKVPVAQSRDVMERMIDCAFAGKCDGVCTMELLPKGEVFFVRPGTRVTTTGGLTFASARKIRVLDGECSGKEGWVYDRMLYAAPSNVPYQQAFASLYRER
jgi:hypothetical protein